MEYKIIPTIIAQNFQGFLKKIKDIEPFFSEASIDFFDGEFVKTKTFSDLTKIKQVQTKLNFNLHLMSTDPEKQIQQILDIEKINKIYFHIEIDKDIKSIIELLKQNNKRVGLALKPKTDIDQLKPYIEYIDSILIMSVKPGYYGSEYIINTPDKIKKTKQLAPNQTIAVDGGVTDQNIKKLAEAGASEFHVGSFLYKGDIKGQKEKLEKALEKSNSKT